MNQVIKIRTCKNIKHAMIIAVRKKVYDAFNRTRTVVPVRTGKLKSSGSNNPIEDGSQTIFRAKYSSFVERGTRPGMRHVRSYVRKDGAFVRGFSYYSKGQRAQKYIEKPLREEFRTLAQEFENQMRQEGFKVQRQ